MAVDLTKPIYIAAVERDGRLAIIAGGNSREDISFLAHITVGGYLLEANRIEINPENPDDRQSQA